MSSSYIPEAVRQEVLRRADALCEYCRCPLHSSIDPFSIEHIVPRAAGGTDVLDNLALSCQGCNNYKAVFRQAVDPLTKGTAPLYHPRLHEWAAHFVWSKDTLTLCGLTPTGRATIQRLQLNRFGGVNLRRLLRLGGQHPPPANP